MIERLCGIYVVKVIVMGVCVSSSLCRIYTSGRPTYCRAELKLLSDNVPAVLKIFWIKLVRTYLVNTHYESSIKS